MVTQQQVDTKQQRLTLRCKVAVCGDAGVGKTALTQMLVSKATVFPNNYKMTAGVDVCVANVDVPDRAPETRVELYLYDTGGNEVYTDETKKYVRVCTTLMRRNAFMS